MDFDLFSNIRIKENATPKYRQLAEALKEAILRSLVAPGDRLPSLNAFASALGINRLTVLRALDDLEIEGWVVKREKSGVYVSHEIPEYTPAVLSEAPAREPDCLPLNDPDVTMSQMDYGHLSFNDGYPDHRLFPAADVGRAYATVLKDYFGKEALSYHDVFGHDLLRQTLAGFIHRSRGIKSGLDNILVTRGSTMGIFLAARSTCKRGDCVAMGEPGYYLAEECFRSLGMEVVKIPVDVEGLDVQALGSVLSKRRIGLVYITPHHHYPTTVTMPAERRLELLRLAREHGFYILEDDYDFDFQYDRSPIMPIASIDQLHSVIYVGGFSKSLSPAVRIGFMAAGSELVQVAGKWRKLIDRQGDTVQELAFHRLIERGIVESSIRRSRKVYHQRRDDTYEAIRKHLDHLYSPAFTSGGLAFWSKVHLEVEAYKTYRAAARARGVYLMNPVRFRGTEELHTRVSFASMTTAELNQAVEILSDIQL